MVQQEIRLTEEKIDSLEQSGWEASVHGHDGKQQSDIKHGLTFGNTSHYDSSSC